MKPGLQLVVSDSAGVVAGLQNAIVVDNGVEIVVGFIVDVLRVGRELGHVEVFERAFYEGVDLCSLATLEVETF